MDLNSSTVAVTATSKEMLMLVFPLGVHVLLKGTLLCCRACNRCRKTEKQVQFFHNRKIFYV